MTLDQWGACLRPNRYRLEDPDDSHSLPWYRVVVDQQTGLQADAGTLNKPWQQTENQLARFPGRTREIRGRRYFYFQNYLHWQSRRAKGDLQSGLRRGLVQSGWDG